MYKDKLGTYPPDNQGSGPVNQLYYELAGTTFDPAANTYTTLDGSAKLDATTLPTLFGPNVTGFQNCTRGNGDEGMKAQKFLGELLPSQVGETNNAKILVASVGWPAGPPNPLLGSTLTPIHYNSSNPTNNTRTYDLWVDIFVGGKTNRICNWSTEALPQ